MTFQSDNVAAVFGGFPTAERAGLLALRARILAIAARDNIPVEETLKWGQPAYLAPKGSTIRLGMPKTGGFALYTHCQTSLMQDFRGLCPDLVFDGNRAVHFTKGEPIPEALDLLILRALTYHL